MPNPTTGGPLYDVSALNVNDLFTSGTTTYNNLVSMLDSISNGTYFSKPLVLELNTFF